MRYHCRRAFLSATAGGTSTPHMLRACRAVLMDYGYRERGPDARTCGAGEIAR